MRNSILVCLILVLLSCQKESFTNSSDVRLHLSADTLRFDTVFTTTGSTTQAFKIFNPNNKGIRISSVQLKGGASSPFKINVQGEPGPQVNNLEVRANDSAYVFVSVSINPTATQLPFVVRDSVEITYNGNKEILQLEAYGQNAHFLRSRMIHKNEVWENDRPYVILGRLEVAPNTQLTIKEGCRVYVHASALFLIHGTLKVEGKQHDSTRVIFSGDRLDAPYKDYPAAWAGLIFTQSSQENELQYTTIKNAYQGLVVQEPSPSALPKLTLKQTIIDNAFDAGLQAENSSIRAENLLISNCGKNIVLLKGGSYSFNHCTVASYANRFIAHKEPVLQVSNAALQNGALVAHDLSASFQNCIFWGEGGEVENEVVVVKSGNTAFSVLFDHVLWKVQSEPQPATIVSALTAPPLFEEADTDKRQYSFRLQEASPAVNAGTVTGVRTDLDGNPRPIARPDLGAFEKQ